MADLKIGEFSGCNKTSNIRRGLEESYERAGIPEFEEIVDVK